MTARPRYGRLALLCAATGVTLVSVLGGMGALPSSADDAATARPRDGLVLSGAVAAPTPSGTGATTAVPPSTVEQPVGSPAAETLPADSGTGRRVVFSESLQRVWLVGRGDDVQRTYPVSGSVHDNLDAGSYEVYSRSQQAWGIDDSGSMRWFVRFAHGDTAAIGFHDIPVDDGVKVQTPAQLGTPLSHGCIRQRTADAKALWRFAPLGTTVVVTR